MGLPLRLVAVVLLMLQHLATLHGRQTPGNPRRFTIAGRSLESTRPAGNDETPDLTASLYDRYHGYITGWGELGVSHHMAVGSWGGQTYQISIWLRFPCSTDKGKREARLVVQLNLAPVRKLYVGNEVVPKELLVGGKLPGIAFTSMQADRAEPVNVSLSYWDELIIEEKRSAVLVGAATLDYGAFYFLEIDGCERVFQIPPRPCSSAMSFFGDDKAWLALGGKAWNPHNHSPKTYAFLVSQYVSHHVRLGFAGLVLVVTPHVATGLLADDDFSAMVKQRQVVLLAWEFSFHPTKGVNNIQPPGLNLIALAMHGAQNFLGVWDVDEYLVLPGHQPIMQEIRQGCLKDLLSQEAEVVLPFELATVADWTDPAGEVSLWKEHGSFLEAAQHVNYTTQAYPHCNGDCLCKSLIDANTNLALDNHELRKPPPKQAQHVVAPRSCAYMLHLFHLWGTRRWGDKCHVKEDWFEGRRPLRLGDLGKVEQ